MMPAAGMEHSRTGYEFEDTIPWTTNRQTGCRLLGKYTEGTVYQWILSAPNGRGQGIDYVADDMSLEWKSVLISSVCDNRPDPTCCLPF